MDARFAGVFLAALALANGALAAATPCDRLAAYARKLPDSAWARGDKALAPVLELDELRPPVTPLEKSLTRLPAARSLADPMNTILEIGRFAGSDLYLLSSTQGTLHCQVFVLVRASPGQRPRTVETPGNLGDGDQCWGNSATFGKVAGEPLFIVHDSIDDTQTKAEFNFRSFDGRAFGPACEVTLRFHAAYTLTERHCGDAAVCAAAGDIAPKVALAYNRAREGGADGAGFTYGPAGAPQVAAGTSFLAAQDSPPTWTPDFPAFDKAASDDHPFSYSGFALFPLTLAGRDLVGAIGHEGVGWREGDNTLFAVYALKDGALTPLAGFVVKRSLAGLANAAVGPPRVAKGR
jgi:hypothetical protein